MERPEGDGACSVVLAISSFRDDDALERLLEHVESSCPSLFAGVIVVDSLPTGKLARTIQQRGWDFVDYRGFADNLGSAGNLAQRLQIAAETGAKYVYAINHDGLLESSVVATLMAEAEAAERVGAVYPLRRITQHQDRYDLTGLRRIPRPFTGKEAPPSDSTTDVFWGSSNGALYALEPVRNGLLPWADLWMGWEDLGYGLLLHERGYRQFVVTRAVLEDGYEYAPRRVGPATVRLSEKPIWYTYYRARNLVLVARRARLGVSGSLGMACRVAVDIVPAVLMRNRKRQRFALFMQGLYDGLRGTSGKWRMPE
jgi:GT2 family glycosyltransferase